MVLANVLSHFYTELITVLDKKSLIEAASISTYNLNGNKKVAAPSTETSICAIEFTEKVILEPSSKLLNPPF